MVPADRERGTLKPCPCGSGATYDACCGPYHRGEREAPDAVALMRSRFSAFARGESEYLYRTLHPDHEDRGLPREMVEGALREAVRSARYMRLRVLDASPPDAEGVARVLFVAGVFKKGRDQSFLECSEFAHDGTGWRYLRAAHREPTKADEPVSVTIATLRARDLL